MSPGGDLDPLGGIIRDIVSQQDKLGGFPMDPLDALSGAHGAALDAAGRVPGGADSFFSAAGTPFNPIGLIITGGLIAYSMIAKNSVKDRRTPGAGFDFDENREDPTASIPIGIGSPVVTPPRLFRYQTADKINKLAPADKVTLFTCLSLGGGPIDGSDLTLWRDGVIVADKVSAEEGDSAIERTLEAVPGTSRTRFLFPALHVIPSSVVIYFDSTVVGQGGEDAGGVFLSKSDTLNLKPVTPRLFANAAYTTSTVLVDSDIPATKTRLGGLFPTDGIVDPDSVKLTMETKSAKAPTWAGVVRGWGGSRAGSKTHTVPAGAVHVGRLDDGRAYFWVSTDTEATRSLDLADVQRFVVSYTVRKRVKIEVDASGVSTAIFDTPVSGGVTVYADYKVGQPDGFKYTLRTGTADQEPLPIDDARNLYAVNGELTVGTASTYSTNTAVDNLEITLASGTDGFYDQAREGANAGETRTARRTVVIRLKTTAAATKILTGSNTDPTKGYVTLRDPNRQTDHFRLEGVKSGKAVWTFNLGGLLAYTQGKDANAAITNTLPREKYTVQVVTTDVAGNRGGDSRNHPTVFSDLFFDTATEIQAVKLVLPYHAMLLIEDKIEQSGATPKYDVGCAMRKFWVPDSDAVYDSVTRRPQPGTWKWTRNPVWADVGILVDPYFGAGQFYTWASNVILADALSGASYCDDSVARTSQDQTTETRSEVDLWLHSRGPLMEARRKVMVGSGVLPALWGGRASYVIDQDGDAVATITSADWHRRTVPVLTRASREERPDVLEAVFTDERIRHQLHSEFARVTKDSANAPVIKRIDLTGVRRVTQVLRVLGRWVDQFREQQETYEVVGSTLEFMQYNAGDIVTFTCAELGVTAVKTRVRRVGYGSNFLTGLELVRLTTGAGDTTQTAGATQTSATKAVGGITSTNAFTKTKPPAVKFGTWSITKVAS